MRGVTEKSMTSGEGVNKSEGERGNREVVVEWGRSEQEIKRKIDKNKGLMSEKRRETG